MSPVVALVLILLILINVPLILSKMLPIIFAIVTVAKYGIHPRKSDLERQYNKWLEPIDDALKPLIWLHWIGKIRNRQKGQ